MVCQEGVEVVGKVALGGSKIALAPLQDDPNNRVVECRQDVRPIGPPDLTCIFVQRHITSIMQPVFDAPFVAGNYQQSVRIRNMSW